MSGEVIGMAVKVLIPSPLRKLTNNQSEVLASGSTVREIIDDLEAQFPGIKERLCDGDGNLRRFVNIFVDQEDVRFLDGLDTKVKSEAEVSIIPAIAGG
jgi:molybdopterin synthase sulfur carrier subunit